MLGMTAPSPHPTPAWLWHPAGTVPNSEVLLIAPLALALFWAQSLTFSPPPAKGMRFEARGIGVWLLMLSSKLFWQTTN